MFFSFNPFSKVFFIRSTLFQRFFLHQINPFSKVFLHQLNPFSRGGPACPGRMPQPPQKLRTVAPPPCWPTCELPRPQPAVLGRPSSLPCRLPHRCPGHHQTRQSSHVSWPSQAWPLALSCGMCAGTAHHPTRAFAPGAASPWQPSLHHTKCRLSPGNPFPRVWPLHPDWPG